MLPRQIGSAAGLIVSHSDLGVGVAEIALNLICSPQLK